MWQNGSTLGRRVADPMRLYSVALDLSGLDLLIVAIIEAIDALWLGVIEWVDSLRALAAHFDTVSGEWTKRLLVYSL